MGLSNMMGQRDMPTNMMKDTMMSRDMYSDMMGREMTSNMMGQHRLSNMRGNGVLTNMMSGRMNTYGNDMNRTPLEQRNTMSQRMQIEQIPLLTASSHQLL